MVDWTDDAIVLTVTRHGESGAVVEALTPARGRVRGYVRGGSSKRQRAFWQPGNRMQLSWRARLAENLGQFQGDLLHAPLGQVMAAGGRVTGLSAALAVVAASTGEGEAQPGLYDALLAVLDLIETADNPLDWGAALVRLELGLLAGAGYGLDLSVCAATGSADDLAYVSPKSGRAVSRAAGAPWQARLLPLPDFLIGKAPPDPAAVIDGLRLTGHFLAAQIWVARPGGSEPGARARFVRWLTSRAELA